MVGPTYPKYSCFTVSSAWFAAEGEAERPEVVQQLLDTASLPSKPSYSMAPEQPLVLHRCGFDRLDIPSHSMQPAVSYSHSPIIAQASISPFRMNITPLY